MSHTKRLHQLPCILLSHLLLISLDPDCMSEDRSLSQSDCSDESCVDQDPGIVFVVASEDKIHQCLGLPAVANLQPTLQQGKKNNKLMATV